MNVQHFCKCPLSPVCFHSSLLSSFLAKLTRFYVIVLFIFRQKMALLGVYACGVVVLRFVSPSHHASLVGSVLMVTRNFRAAALRPSVFKITCEVLTSCSEGRAPKLETKVLILTVWMDEWMNTCLCFSLKLKSWKKDNNSKINFFKFLTSKEKLRCFTSKALLQNDWAVLVNSVWHSWEFYSKLWAFLSLGFEEETKQYMSKPAACLGWIQRD